MVKISHFAAVAPSAILEDFLISLTVCLILFLSLAQIEKHILSS